jgi:FixJ family two-component response regulator
MSQKPGIVYIIDDEAGMRKALSRLLAAEGYEPRPFASADEFLAAYTPDESSCLILDVAMPDIDGMEFQRRLNNLHLPLPVVFLTGHGSIPMSVRGIKEGAVDFLTKPVNDDDLLRAVRMALAQANEERSNHSLTSKLKNRHTSLTPRESEVMALVVKGKLNKQIAAELGTSEQNIKIHRGRVMRKMGASSLVDLVHAADHLRRNS